MIVSLPVIVSIDIFRLRKEEDLSPEILHSLWRRGEKRRIVGVHKFEFVLRIDVLDSVKLDSVSDLNIDHAPSASTKCRSADHLNAVSLLT